MKIVNSTGKRKTAIARVFLTEGKGKIKINKREFANYFTTINLQTKALKPLQVTDTANRFDISVNVLGGGVNGQAEAVQLGIARGLCKIDPEFKKLLKKDSLLTRDSRIVERKKAGLKKARKASQFSKR